MPNKNVFLISMALLTSGIIIGDMLKSREKIREFNYVLDGKTNHVLTLERYFARDYVFIEDFSGNFITIEKYLKKIRDNSERKVVESGIKNLINR